MVKKNSGGWTTTQKNGCNDEGGGGGVGSPHLLSPPPGFPRRPYQASPKASAPRRFIKHPTHNYLILLETDHRTHTNQDKEEIRRELKVPNPLIPLMLPTSMTIFYCVFFPRNPGCY